MNIQKAQEVMMNELTHSLYLFYKSKIKFLIISQPDLASNYKMQFDNFLNQMHRKKGKIYFAITSDQNKEIEIIGNANDLKFIWSLKSDKSSSFEIHFIQKHKTIFNSGFLTSKIKKTFGYVYLLKSEYGYKVGCSAKLNERINRFGVLLPFKFSVDSIIKCSDYMNTEKIIHNIFSNKRLNGEWFNLSESDLNELDIILSNMSLKREEFFNG
ncbi:MAG: GIY-YIG nuclease family protein [Bacteroidetes bacterium]|nr:GIY-YIG nuclease family protein [Bacteroidota bacterium]